MIRFKSTLEKSKTKYIAFAHITYVDFFPTIDFFHTHMSVELMVFNGPFISLIIYAWGSTMLSSGYIVYKCMGSEDSVF